jgi:hypothetical protein
LAIDGAAKKIAVGKSKDSIVILGFSDVVSYRVEKKPNYHEAFVIVVTNNINNPSYSIRFSSLKNANQCFDTLQAALSS